ncbi:phosphatase PAP2 family protein [Ornithinimicrobium pratense]|uniref:Phosphatase PAP2 family protein n=1 Tax=Ornithinimicrobium pratense TaxID=2593973 RepID=A0A5J6V648_9MICO|nr:phosphatase PAP2 family protein [Ornithinimicrobium pratense]QFG68651.1 phosphatase PAP2 family protein [Ornithinimicrobium pratense]
MPDRDHPPPALPWGLITVGTLGVLGLYAVFVLSTTGQAWDTAVMDRASARPGSRRLAEAIVEELGPMRMVLLCGMACLTGLLRHWRVALGAGVAVMVCLAGPQILKATLPRPQLADPWPMPNSLPSGHTAAVAALAVALVLVLPLAWRGLVLLVGTGATALMGAMVVVLSYHRPSDVLASASLALAAWGAGLLVQGRWAASTRAGSGPAQRRPRARGGSVGGYSPSSEPSSAS